MPETAESHMMTLDTNRCCVIEIKNYSTDFCLFKPMVHMESGLSFSPPTPTLRSNFTEVCSFIKNDNTASGAVGVMTYDLYHVRKQLCTNRMAIMFSVPHDYNFYKNWMAVGILDKSCEASEKLFKTMYNDEESSFVRREGNGSCVVFRGETLEVRASMSDEGKAIVKMELFDRMR